METTHCKPCSDRGEVTVASRLGPVPKCSWCAVGLEGPNDPKAYLYNFSKEPVTAAAPVQRTADEVEKKPAPGFEEKVPAAAEYERSPHHEKQIDLAELKKDYERGMSHKDLSRKHGFPFRSAGFYLDKAQVAQRMDREPSRKTIPDYVTEGLQLHVKKTLASEKCRCGKPSGHVGACKGVSRGPYKPEKAAKAKELLSDGKTIREVARETGLAKRTIGEIRKTIEVPPCKCGKPGGHKGWCKERFKKSPARQETMKKIRKGHETPTTTDSVSRAIAAIENEISAAETRIAQLREALAALKRI